MFLGILFRITGKGEMKRSIKASDWPELGAY